MIRDVLFLNGLRAIAAFWVVIAHCMIWGGWTATTIPDPKLAVDLFMMISGFLMSYNARLRETKEPMRHPSTWMKFYIRRYFRIAPAYYLSLALAALSAPIFLSGYKQLQLLNPDFWGTGGIYDPATIRYTLSNVVAHITFTFGMLPKYVFSTMLPDWSLSLEMQFYLAFPFLYLLMRKTGPALGAIVVCAISFLIARTFASNFPEPGFLPLKMSLFIVGMLIAELPFGSSLRSKIEIGALSLVLPFAQASHFQSPPWLLPAMSASLYMLTLTRGVSGRASKLTDAILGGRVSHVLSEASYGLYLFHGFFIAFSGHFLFGNLGGLQVAGNARTVILWAIVVPGSPIVAIAVSRTIERFGVSIGRAITS